MRGVVCKGLGARRRRPSVRRRRGGRNCVGPCPCPILEIHSLGTRSNMPLRLKLSASGVGLVEALKCGGARGAARGAGRGAPARCRWRGLWPPCPPVPPPSATRRAPSSARGRAELGVLHGACEHKRSSRVDLYARARRAHRMTCCLPLRAEGCVWGRGGNPRKRRHGCQRLLRPVLEQAAAPQRAGEPRRGGRRARGGPRRRAGVRGRA
jgi:hypothetical protein